MIQLHNGCYCSEFAVHPKNWQSASANMHCLWYISYRFYDPRIDRGSKQVIIKGMNHLTNLNERRSAVKILMDAEMKLLVERGFNKITKQFEIIDSREITEHSTLYDALDFAYKELEPSEDGKKKIDEQTLGAVRSCKNRILNIIIKYQWLSLRLKDIKTRHIRKLLSSAQAEYKLSASSFNHYRAYLIMLFKVIKNEDAIEYNPVLNIDKQIVLEKQKTLFTDSERKMINDHFKNTDVYYHRFIHCFFHSGARGIELLQIKKPDVDLINKTYKIIVEKGKLYEEQVRPIKDIAFEYWKAQYDECNDDNFYLFGSLLRPGPKKGTRDYITKKWHREIKKGKGINKNFYWLKAQNLDETAAWLDAEHASKLAGHTSTVITLKHYLPNEKSRQMERLRKVNNAFA